jgi:hypothetical protein
MWADAAGTGNNFDFFFSFWTLSLVFLFNSYEQWQICSWVHLLFSSILWVFMNLPFQHTSSGNFAAGSTCYSHPFFGFSWIFLFNIRAVATLQLGPLAILIHSLGFCESSFSTYEQWQICSWVHLLFSSILWVFVDLPFQRTSNGKFAVGSTCYSHSFFGFSWIYCHVFFSNFFRFVCKYTSFGIIVLGIKGVLKGFQDWGLGFQF